MARLVNGSWLLRSLVRMQWFDRSIDRSLSLDRQLTNVHQMTNFFGWIVVGRVPRYVRLGLTVSHVGQPTPLHTLKKEVQSRVRNEFHASLRLEQTSLMMKEEEEMRLVD